MRRLACVLALFLLTGCPADPAPASPPPADPAAQRAADVEAETRLAEGGDAVQAEAPQSDDAGDVAVAQQLPELRYYAFDG
jgi:hypothetical protein